MSHGYEGCLRTLCVLEQDVEHETFVRGIQIARRLIGQHQRGPRDNGSRHGNALLLARKIDDYEPSPYLTFSIHLDGDRERHDASVCQEGVYDRAVAAIELALERGFRVTINCTLFNGEDPDEVAEFFDDVMAMGVEGITISPGYSYSRDFDGGVDCYSLEH